jgi:hypothetical protein
MSIRKLRDEVRALRGQVPPQPQRIHHVVQKEHETLAAALKREGIRREAGDFLVVRKIVSPRNNRGGSSLPPEVRPVR